MDETKLSRTMRDALNHAREHSGLVRYPGGFWMRGGLDVGNHTWVNRKWFGTATVQALVSRGKLTYSKWQEGRNGRFPIEATIPTENEHGRDE